MRTSKRVAEGGSADDGGFWWVDDEGGFPGFTLHVSAAPDDHDSITIPRRLAELIARAEKAEADVVRMTAEIAALEEDLALEEKWGEAVVRRAERAEEQRDRARAYIRSSIMLWRDDADAAVADDPPQRGDR